MRCEVAKVVVVDCAGGAVDDHHARGGAVSKRLLGDEVIGELVVEIGSLHA